jgi:hypothetical protein
LLAANGEQLTDLELLTFTKYTGRAKAPEKRVDELWCAVGRRGGKSRAMATMAAYYAGLCDYRDKLARGETGVVPPDARHLWRSPDLYIEPLRSPWGLMGHVQETHYGPEGDPMLLVAQGASRDFNPDLPQSVVDRALDRDPLANRAEFMAEFRTDVESLLTIETVNAVIDPGVKERAPDLKHSYVAFVDPSGGSSDSMTLAIAHKEGETEVLDLIREVRAPFSPEAVVEEFSSTMQRYRCSRCYGDRYGAAWPVEQFQKAGIHLEPSEKPKNALYLDLLPLINSRAVRLLDHERMSCSS